MKKNDDLKLWHITGGMLLGMVAISLMMCGCKQVEYVTVREVMHDSIFQTKTVRDSVWLHDSISVESKGDTVRVDRWHTKYVEKQVHDTIYQSRTDSVPAPFPVKEYVQKPLAWHQKTLMTIGLLTLMAIIIICGLWLSKHQPFR